MLATTIKVLSLLSVKLLPGKAFIDSGLPFFVKVNSSPSLFSRFIKDYLLLKDQKVNPVLQQKANKEELHWQFDLFPYEVKCFFSKRLFKL